MKKFSPTIFLQLTLLTVHRLQVIWWGDTGVTSQCSKAKEDLATWQKMHNLRCLDDNIRCTAGFLSTQNDITNHAWQDIRRTHPKNIVHCDVTVVFPHILIRVRDHSLSAYAKFSQKLTFFTSSCADVCVRIRQ